MKGPIFATIGLAFAVTLGAQVNGRGRAPRAIEVVALQQAADSIRVEVAWTAPTAGASQVVGYRVRVTGPGWTRGRERPATARADSLWLPKDTVDANVNVCVNATTAGADGPAACSTYTVPARIIPVGPPGAPTVRPLGGLAVLIDSVRIVFDVVQAGPQDAVDEAGFWLVGFMAGPTGSPIAVTCSLMPDGRIGWAEVYQTGSASIETVGSGAFANDPDCGWQLDDLDPEISSSTYHGPSVIGGTGSPRPIPASIDHA